MKIIYSILCFLIVGCASEKTETPKDILSTVQFEDILKEVHLAEAVFELEKGKDMNAARNNLSLKYKKIFNQHHTNSTQFNATLNYYSATNELEQIYNTIAKELTQEKKTLKK